MFGLIGNIVSAAVKTVTLPVSAVVDLANGEIAPRTERKIEDITDNVKDIFDPSEW